MEESRVVMDGERKTYVSSDGKGRDPSVHPHRSRLITRHPPSLHTTKADFLPPRRNSRGSQKNGTVSLDPPAHHPFPVDVHLYKDRRGTVGIVCTSNSFFIWKQHSMVLNS